MSSVDIFGVKIPDSILAREINELIRDTESEMLFYHSQRVYLWAALLGNRRGLNFDQELLYAAAMFHDIGITQHYQNSQLRFEIDGANTAREFLKTHQIAESDIEKVWLAVALHTTPGIPEHMHPEVALIQAGAGMDMIGRGFDEFKEEERNAVLSAFPRGANFEHEVIETFYNGLSHRPASTFGTFNDDFLAFKDPAFQRGNMCSLLLHSPWCKCAHSS
ncbi:HD domain-containing protein [Enterobacter genomosp. O]|uniref:Phosphohydrolase n=1 Tax=Enterobacter genomosp. O TaxID=2364150 RepID=A0A0X4ET17_9ENTR|nr:HD domain-containing protein [Enterobacter genomosp. O]KUQ84831.1 phosphohydrolase [Enterobacter genomosp. O]